MSKTTSQKLTKKRKEQMIRDLQRENRKLRKENEYLKHLSMQYDEIPKDEESPEQKILSVAVKRTYGLNAKNYFSYIFQRIRNSKMFLIFDKTRFAMKVFKFAKKMWIVSLALLAFLGISMQVLVTIGLLAVLLPVVLTISAVIGLSTFLSLRKRNKILRHLFSEYYEGKIYFVFLPKNQSDSYFARTASALTESGDVFFVTQSFRECGWKSLLQTEDHIYKIHISAYFSFARRVHSEKTVKIHL